MNSTTDYWDNNYITHYVNENLESFIFIKCIILPVIFFICCVGLVLNGSVIWFLGFHSKRNPFTVFILNLAIADFGYLINMVMYCIDSFINFGLRISEIIIFPLHKILYVNGLFLLTAISIDLCVSVLFPTWYRCSRPKYLSPAICAFLWVFSFLLVQILNFASNEFRSGPIWNLHLLVTALFCFSLIIISTLILLVKIRFKSNQIKHRRLLVTILITLLCFLILTLPYYLYSVITSFLVENYFLEFLRFESYFNVITSLNSSIKPVIYFLAGRKKNTQSRDSMKIIFQRVFREGEDPEN